MRGILNTPADIENFVKIFEVIRKTIGDTQFVINVSKEDEKMHIYVQDGGKTVMNMIHLNIGELFTNFEYSGDNERIGIRDISKFVGPFKVFNSNLTVSTENNGSVAAKVLLHDADFNVTINVGDPENIDEAPQSLKAQATKWIAEFETKEEVLGRFKKAISVMPEKYVKFTNDNNKLRLQVADPGAGTDSCDTSLGVDVDNDVDVTFFRERVNNALCLGDHFNVKISPRVVMLECNPENTVCDVVVYIAAST